MLIHVIEPGDTLWELGKLYHVSAADIAAANGIRNPEQLVVGQALVIPTREGVVTGEERRTVEVNAYFVQFTDPAPHQLDVLAPVLTYVSPFSYQAETDGSIRARSDETALVDAALNQSVMPMLVLTNWHGDMFNSDVAHAIFTSPSAQEKILTNVLRVMNDKGYRALNLDFEYVYAHDRDLYNAFVERCAERVRKEGFLLSSALAPKLYADQPGLLYEAHDYHWHGEVCDFVILMTYEWGWIGGPPMPVSPVDQIRKVLNYAITAIPRDKILMGVSVYGYDWTLPYRPGTRAATLTPVQAVNLAYQQHVPIQYDLRAEAPYFTYTDAQGRHHIVWFEDPRSFQAKQDLVVEYNLRGMSFWSYPTSFPQVPILVNNQFNTKKWTWEHTTVR